METKELKELLNLTDKVLAGSIWAKDIIALQNKLTCGNHHVSTQCEVFYSEDFQIVTIFDICNDNELETFSVSGLKQLLEKHEVI